MELREKYNKVTEKYHKVRWAMGDCGGFEAMTNDLTITTYNDGLCCQVFALEQRRLRQTLAPEVSGSRARLTSCRTAGVGSNGQ